MDSPIVTRLFRDLFRHPACQSRQRLSARLRPAANHICRQPHHHQRRQYAVKSGLGKGEKTNESRWQQRTQLFPADRSEEFETYPLVTAEDLKGRDVRPRKVKMLMRDFVDDSLYNPNYGYFSKNAVIFSPGQPFDFPAFSHEPAFYKELGHRYTEFEDALDDKEGVKDDRPLWHTPTELFRPYYGEAIARYLVSNYRLTTYPYHDLIIYEMGAGRGTLMLNILDYIRDMDPQVYARTKYKIIEISSSLAALQGQNLLRASGHADKVDIINKSIFDWNERVPSPCFFLALEVFDNFAHDCLRYDLRTEEPLQARVLIDDDGDFYEFYDTRLDPYLDVLERYFPAHRLLTSDFHALPDAIEGLNAPVVQTRFERRTVPVTTPLVHQGYFDIMFPTDFNVVEAMYQVITGKLTRVSSHGDFMRRWAYLEDTETRSGENPLLSYYQNASVMVTV
ncbi:hypothetical protein VdG2_03614 [Verticillium dahliae VDG2]|nr:hypothetical protein VdG2_03614 [Verticillium dahliae VDG2]